MQIDCLEAQERISLRPLERKGGPPQDPDLAGHLAECASCAADAGFMARVAAARPELPAGLRSRVLRSLPEPRPGIGWWTGSVAAAAVMILAMGAGLVSQRIDTHQPMNPLDGFVLEDPDPGWGDDEWYVAGAPVWDALPDEMLLALLQEDTW
jgi:hypothetical protein